MYILISLACLIGYQVCEHLEKKKKEKDFNLHEG